MTYILKTYGMATISASLEYLMLMYLEKDFGP